MPLVERMVEQEMETTFGKAKVPHVLYVAPKDVRPGDKVVEPASDEQRADLAKLYPDEFAAPDAPVGKSIAGLGAKEAVALIEAADEGDTKLVDFLGEELERDGGPRKTVIEALAARGVTE